MPRGSGKTALLIKESARNQKPIIVGSESAVQCIIDQAYEMGERIPEPINASRYINNWNYRHDVDRGMDRYSGLLIDEVDYVLKQIFRNPIDKVTCTPNKTKEVSSMNSLDNIFDSINETLKQFNDVIMDINVIVPEKVVEIRFGDGNKEKMVCHEDDTFDLRKCCFIAIAKHLYKKEYTQEGIEYMATQLAYQKKYVKIVDKALKDYWKKEEGKEKKIRDEHKRQEIQERQREKRRRYKERRTQRYKEAMIDLIADSINEARTRRKRYKE